MIKHFCDRCGEEIPKDDERTYVQVTNQHGVSPSGMNSEYKLCQKCQHELKDYFLRGKEDAT